METENTKPQEGMKICSRCGRLLPLDSFYKYSQSKDGHQNYCKECTRDIDRGRKYRKRSPIYPPNFNSLPSGGGGQSAIFLHTETTYWRARIQRL